MESMEWGVDFRNSRWNPWNGGWTPYFFKMDSMKCLCSWATAWCGGGEPLVGGGESSGLA